MGPFELMGSFLHTCEWAHSSSSAGSLIEKVGPIHGHQHFSSGSDVHFLSFLLAYSLMGPHECFGMELYLLLVSPHGSLARTFLWAHP